MAENIKRLQVSDQGRAVLARHKVISAIVLGIILGNKYQVQVMNIFENNKPNILFREHFNGMYGTDAFFYAKQVVEMLLHIVNATKMLSLIYWNVNPNVALLSTPNLLSRG